MHLQVDGVEQNSGANSQENSDDDDDDNSEMDNGPTVIQAHVKLAKTPRECPDTTGHLVKLH